MYIGDNLSVKMSNIKAFLSFFKISLLLINARLFIVKEILKWLKLQQHRFTHKERK